MGETEQTLQFQPLQVKSVAYVWQDPSHLSYIVAMGSCLCHVMMGQIGIMTLLGRQLLPTIVGRVFVYGETS